jgi:hypothetical protein
MGPEHETALETEHEVLADGLDRFEPPPVEAFGDPLRSGPRVRGLDLDPIADQHLKPRRRSVKRVAFRH